VSFGFPRLKFADGIGSNCEAVIVIGKTIGVLPKMESVLKSPASNEISTRNFVVGSLRLSLRKQTNDPQTSG
jgi:hypothetical protein